MDGSFDFASLETASRLRLRIIGAVNHRHIARVVRLIGNALDKVRVHQAHFVSGIQPLVLRNRLRHEVLPLDPELTGESDLPASQCLVLQIVRCLQLLALTFRIIVNDKLQRVQNSQHTAAGRLQILTDAVLQCRVVVDGLALGNACHLHEFLDGGRCVAAAAKTGNGNQSRIVPAVHNSLFHESLDIALAGHDVLEVELGELDLARRLRELRLPDDPVIERAVILELQRADGVGNSLNRILDRVREIIHRIDAPLVPGVLMRQVRHAVEDRIAHVDVGRCHVDLRAKRLLAVGVFSFLHLLEQPQVLLDGALPHRIVPARLRERPAIFAHLIRRKVGHIGLSLADQLQRDLIHLVKIVAGEKESVLVVRPQPLDVFLDRFHELGFLLRRIRVVKAEIELAAVLLRKTVIQKNALRMADVEIAVRLRRKAGLHVVVPSLRQILVDLQLNKILVLSVEGLCLLSPVRGALDFICTHISQSYFSLTL